MPLYCTLQRDGEAIFPDPDNPGWSRTDLHTCLAWVAAEQQLPDDWTISQLKLPHIFQADHDATYYEDNRRSDHRRGAVQLHTTVRKGDQFHAWRG